MSFHQPSMFADCAMFSYGRAFAAWGHLFLYGFAIPSGLGVGIWLLARLGKTEVAQPFLIAVGAKIWHLGVLIGLVAILVGKNAGYEWFEMPQYASITMFLGFLLIAIWVFVTYSRRREPSLYPSQWFVLAALFWFSWIFSTAILLLQLFPVRGVVQVAVAWWFGGNLLNVWLPLAGLAAALYLAPKIAGKPLHSHYLAMFLFLTLILFGAWTGLPVHAPLPAWMSTLSGIATVMMIVPALAVLAIVFGTTRGAKVESGGKPLCFAKFGAVALVLAIFLAAIAACPEVARITEFTWFGNGVTALRFYGFFAMTMFGAAYYLLPLVTGMPISAGRIRAHFWLAMPGSLLLGIPLLIGGIAQGSQLADSSVPFLDASKAALMWFRLSTLGELMIALGTFLFALNILGLMIAYYRSVAKVVVADAIALQPAEVKP